MRWVSRIPAPLLVVAAIASVQWGGALASALIGTSSPATVCFARLGIAAAALVIVVRPSPRGHTRGAWATVAAFGAILAGMNWVFYESLRTLPLGVAVTIEFVGPLALAAVLSRRLRDAVAVAAAAGGVGLMAWGAGHSLTGLPWRGMACALAAGALWAAYILVSARTGRRFAGLDGLTWAMLIAALLVAPAGVAGVADFTPAQAASGAAVAMLSSVVPYSLELVALRRMSEGAFGILMSLEPAVAAAFGFVLLAQRLSGPQWVGMVCVVAASVAVSRHNTGPTEPQPPTA